MKQPKIFTDAEMPTADYGELALVSIAILLFLIHLPEEVTVCSRIHEVGTLETKKQALFF